MDVKPWEWVVPPVALAHSSYNLVSGDQKPRDVLKSIPVVGNLAANVLAGPDTEQAEQAYRDAQQFYQNYRPQVYAARADALQKAMQFYQPVNNKLTELYGAGAAPPPVDWSSMYQMPQVPSQGVTPPPVLSGAYSSPKRG